MSRDEFKKIFFELLTEDEDFKKRLTEFILNAVAEKFVEKIPQVDEPPKSEEVKPAIEQGSYSKEFVEKVIEQADFDKLNAEKFSLETERDNLKTERDNLRGEKESAENQREEFKRQAESLQREKESAENQREEFKRQAESLQREKESAENQREEFKRQAETLQREKESAENQREEFKRQAESLQREKESAESQREEFKRQAESLQREKESAENQREEFKRQAETLQREKESAENQREEFKRQAETLQREKESAESQRDDLQKQLAERFAEGWEVYKAFLTLDDNSRKESGLYSENFEAFICSGAQMKNLEDIWGLALDCKRKNNFNDAEIFWKVFAYCVRLVNAAQGTKIIEILNTQIGERYDINEHTTNGISTQGVVSEIILAGYRNTYNRKIVKKSNVRVG